MNVIENFMEDDIIKNIIEFYENAKNNQELQSNEKHWANPLWEGNTGEVELLNINKLPLTESIIPATNLPDVDLLNLKYLYFYFAEKFKNTPEFKNFVLADCKLHIWHPGSSINWHNDNDEYGMSRIGATIYLNKKWEEKYGGLFLYVKDGEKKWYCPKYNDCIWFQSPMDHLVTMVTGVSPEPRLSIQLFFQKKITPEDW